MAILNGVDILDTNIWWFGGGSAAPAIELIYIFCQRMGIEVDVNMEAVGRIRTELLEARKGLKAFDLAKEMPIDFDPLTDQVPAEILARFDAAIEAAKAGDEDRLLNECHAIEDYFHFPKPNELVKTPKCPVVCTPTWWPSSRLFRPKTCSKMPWLSSPRCAAMQASYLW